MAGARSRFCRPGVDGVTTGTLRSGALGGRKAVQFDAWGDSVNTASRMESPGAPGRIHVAATTRELLSGSAAFEDWQVDVKGLGLMTTYLLDDH